MRREAAQDLKPIQTNAHKKTFPSSDYDQWTPTQSLLFSPSFKAPIERQSWKMKQSMTNRSTEGIYNSNSNAHMEPFSGPSLRHAHSYFAEGDKSSPTWIKQINRRSIDDSFYFLQSHSPKHPSFSLSSPRNHCKEEENTYHHDADQAKPRSHQRVRTESAVSSTTIRARNLLTPKRWSALFTSKTNSNHSSHSASSPLLNNLPNGILKKNGKVNSPRFEDAKYHPLPNTPMQISQPYSVSAHPSSALSNAVMASGKYISTIRNDARWIGGDVTGYGAETDKITFSPIERSESQTSLESQFRRATLEQNYEDWNESYYKQSRTDSEPIEHLAENKKGKQIEKIRNDESEDASNLADQSAYLSANECSFMSVSQSYATCLTSTSQHSISTPGLSTDDGKSTDGSLANEQIPLPFPMAYTNSYPRFQTPSSQSTDLSECDKVSIEDWGSRPEGLCVENGDELPTRLRLMLSTKAEQGRQSRLRAWRRHAKSETNREEALETLMVRESSSKDVEDLIPKASLRPKVSIVDFLRQKEEEKILNDYENCFQSHSQEKMDSKSIKVHSEDDTKSARFDFTMDATSILENDLEPVEIRTAWRGQIGHLKGIGASLNNYNLDESIDLNHQEHEDQSILTSDYSLDCDTFSSNETKKDSLKDATYRHDAFDSGQFVKSKEKKDLLMEEPLGRDELSSSKSETPLADDGADFDLCEYLLQRASENNALY